MPHVDIQPFPLGRGSRPFVLHSGDCRREETERPCNFLAELFPWLDRSGLGRHPDMGVDAGPSPGAGNRQSVFSGFGSLPGLRRVFTAGGKILSNVRRSDYDMTFGLSRLDLASRSPSLLVYRSGIKTK